MSYDKQAVVTSLRADVKNKLNTEAEGGKIRALLWSSMDKMQPLCDSVEKPITH